MQLLTPSFGLIIWTLLAFLIVFFILKKFAWKPILSSLKERETGIANALATADKVKAEMASLKNENEALMAQAREERSQMIKDAKEATNKMIAEAKEKARTRPGVEQQMAAPRPLERAGICHGAARLRKITRLGAAPWAVHDAGPVRDHLPQRLVVHHRAQGILSAAGCRQAGRQYPGRPGHLIPGHAGQARGFHRAGA